MGLTDESTRVSFMLPPEAEVSRQEVLDAIKAVMTELLLLPKVK
jgi:hypothetical protein